MTVIVGGILSHFTYSDFSPQSFPILSLSTSLFQGKDKLHQPRLFLNQTCTAGDALPFAADGAAGSHTREPPRPAPADSGSAGRQRDQRKHQRVQTQEGPW